MLTLVIKADPFTAFALATIHDIDGLEFVKEPHQGETILRCPQTTKHVNEAAYWMTETPHHAPFPIGALLFYSFSTKGADQ